MTRTKPFDAWAYAPIIGIAAAAAVVAGLLLVGIGTPSGFQRRLAALDQRTEQLRRWTSVRPSAAHYPQGAVCAMGVAKAEDLLRAGISNQAQAGRLTMSALDVGVDRDAPLGQTLAPLRVRFQVQGSYQGLVELMDRLSQTRPLLFVDNLDLISNTTSVTMKFSGRAYCSA
jgi:hypothetical protein